MYKVLNVIPKSNSESDRIEYTEIQILCESPYILITSIVEGDFTKESKPKLIELALEDFYQKTYLHRAENEKIKKLNEAVEKTNLNVEKSDKILEKIEERMVLIQKALLELVAIENTEDTPEEETEEGAENEINNE